MSQLSPRIERVVRRAQAAAADRGSKTISISDVIRAVLEPSLGEVVGDASMVPAEILRQLEAADWLAEREGRDEITISDLAFGTVHLNEDLNDVAEVAAARSDQALAVYGDRVYEIGSKLDGWQSLDNSSRLAVVRLVCGALADRAQSKTESEVVLDSFVESIWRLAIDLRANVPEGYAYGVLTWILAGVAEALTEDSANHDSSRG